MLHRSRDLLIRQRTALVNALRGHFAELGIVVGQGIRNVAKLVEEATKTSIEQVPALARTITATAIVATITNAVQFRSVREFSAWIGLVPRQHSSVGKERLGGISKRGDA